MTTFESTRSRSLPVLPSYEGDVTPRSALVAARAAASAAAAATAAVSTAKAAVLSAKTPGPYSDRSLLSDPSSDSVAGKPCTGPSFTHKIGHGRLGFKTDVSYIARHPCSTNYLNTSPSAVPGSSSGPVPGSSPSTVPASRSGPVSSSRSGPVPGSRSSPVPGSRSGPGPGRGYGSSKGTGLDSRLGCASELAPGNDPELSPNALTSFRHPGANLAPNYASGNHYQYCGPQKQPWTFLPVSEPVAQRGLWKTPEVEVKCEVPGKTLPRGHCLLYNWEEERATNHLDQVPSVQDGSESFYFRHGHQGLLTLQLQSPMPLSTTQKDAYQTPRNRCQPIRGKREAMLEILLSHQICKEVQAEQELTRKQFEVESVTHHDYKKELVQAGAPAPTKVRTHSALHVKLSFGGLWGSSRPRGLERELQAKSYSVFFPHSLMTTARSNLKLSGYRGHHSYRVSVTSRHWTRHSGRIAASQHQCHCPWNSLFLMDLRIIPTNWDKSLLSAVREEGRAVRGVELSKG
ncbi:PREDICTED: sperm-associated antigen 8 isoform X1 [Myotis davidii]|uniref:sperm-associated antigen 8 isoform X1 n=1 Tax=Myotis davidii TaxID=225400 RepID=UPI00076727D1|nr:PREDICTED: sperm-associated antigen 8 isoform X1 [Myotis davidii]